MANGVSVCSVTQFLLNLPLLYSRSEGYRVVCHLSCIFFTFRLRVASSVEVFLPGSSVLAS